MLQSTQFYFIQHRIITMDGAVRFGSCVGIYKGGDVVDSDEEPLSRAAVFTNPTTASPTVKECGLKGKKRFYTPEGKVYYYDPVSGESTWELGDGEVVISSRESSLRGVSFEDFMNKNNNSCDNSLLDEDEMPGICFGDFIEREQTNMTSDSTDIDAFLELQLQQTEQPIKNSISARPPSTESNTSDSIPSYLLADIPEQGISLDSDEHVARFNPFLSSGNQEFDEDELLGAPSNSPPTNYTTLCNNNVEDDINLLSTDEDEAIAELIKEEHLLTTLDTDPMVTPPVRQKPKVNTRPSRDILRGRHFTPHKSLSSLQESNEIDELLGTTNVNKSDPLQELSFSPLTSRPSNREIEDDLLAGLELTPKTPVTNIDAFSEASNLSPPTHVKKATAKLNIQRRDFEEQVAKEKALEDERRADFLREQQKLEEQRRELQLLKEEQERQRSELLQQQQEKDQQSAQLEAQQRELEQQKQKLSEDQERQQNDFLLQQQQSAFKQQQLLHEQQQQFEASLNTERQQLLEEREKSRQSDLMKQQQMQAQIAAKQKELSSQEKMLKVHQQEFVKKLESDKEIADRQYKQQQHEIECLKKAQREEHDRVRVELAKQQQQLINDKKNITDRQKQLVEQQQSQEMVYVARQNELKDQQIKIDNERIALQQQQQSNPDHQQLESDLLAKESELKQQQNILQSEQQETVRRTQLLQEELDSESSQHQITASRLQEVELEQERQSQELVAISPEQSRPRSPVVRKKPPPHAILSDTDTSFYAYRQRIRKELALKNPPVEKIIPEKPKTPIKCIVKKLGGKLGKEWNKRQMIIQDSGVVLHDEGFGGGNRKYLGMQSIKKITQHPTDETILQIISSTSVKPTSLRMSPTECASLVKVLTLLRRLYSPTRFDAITEFGKTATHWPAIKGFYCYKLHSSFSSKSWIPKYIQSDGITISMAKRKGGDAERSFRAQNIQYCGLPEDSEVCEAEPQFLSKSALVIQVEDKNLYLSFESMKDRDKYLEFINDAIFQTDDSTKVPISSVAKNEKRKALDAAANWMSKNWSDSQWKTWECDALDKWSDDVVYDIALYTDTIEEPFISDGEDETDWPKKQPSKQKKPLRSSTVLTSVPYKKNNKGKLGIPLTKTSEIRVAQFPSEGEERDQCGIRIPSGSHITAIGPYKSSISTVSEYESALERHPAEGEIHYYPPPVGEEYFDSSDYNTILGCPVILGKKAPSPMPACLELTPEEVRDHLRKERQKKRCEEDDLHKERQFKRQQTADEATERLDAAAAKASFVAHAAKGAVLGALRRGKQKASDKLRETLMYQITKRYSERFSELQSSFESNPLCNYKCTINLQGYNGFDQRTQDSHVLLTPTHICYCSGGKATEKFRGWIPLTDVVSIQYGKKVHSEDMLAEYITIDWTIHDTAGSDCLQIYTNNNHRYDFIKIRVINIEKKESIQGVDAIDGLFSYVDNAWRDLVPDPEYTYDDY